MNKAEQLKKNLAAGKVCLGTHCWTQDLDFYEMCGWIGYDYIWIDNEHGGMSWPMIKNAIIAANAGGCSAIVRVQDHETAHIKPVIEAGPDGIIFPMVNTPQEAKKCVDACMYPPKGKRGFGPGRAIDYGLKPMDEYLETIDDCLFKIVQCESAEAVRNLDKICKVPGVDAVICGPMDLSGSVGKLGEFFDPEVKELMRTIALTCKAHGKPFGVSVGYAPELIEFWKDLGASFLSMGNPQDYFRIMSQQMLERFRVNQIKK